VSYALLLLLFGLLPLGLLWRAAPWIPRRHPGSLLVIVILILAVSVPWEALAVNRLWFYSPEVIWGPSILNVPVEELAFFALDGLLVGTLAIWLGERYRVRT